MLRLFIFIPRQIKEKRYSTPCKISVSEHCEFKTRNIPLFSGNCNFCTCKSDFVNITLNYIELYWIIFLVCASSNHVIVSAFIVMPWFRINFKMRIDFKIRRLLVVAFTVIFFFSALRLTMLMILFVTNFTTFSYDICRCCE